MGGTLIGVLQQRILRRHMGRSVWWVVASVIGWGLSVIGLAIPLDVSDQSLVVAIIRNVMLAPAIAGVILGTVTGGALI